MVQQSTQKKTQIKIRQGKYYVWKGVVIIVLCAKSDKWIIVISKTCSAKEIVCS